MKDSHSVKVLQVKCKHIEKTRNAEQEYSTKSRDIIVILVDTKLNYYWNNGIPIGTQGENDDSSFYSNFYSNSMILLILHQTTLVIRTFMRMFIIKLCQKNDYECASLVEKDKELFLCLM
jgi:hypothetical protein